MGIKQWVVDMVDAVDVDIDKTIQITQNTRLRIKVYTEKNALGNRYDINPNEAYYEGDKLARKMKCNANNVNVNVVKTSDSQI